MDGWKKCKLCDATNDPLCYYSAPDCIKYYRLYKHETALCPSCFLGYGIRFVIDCRHDWFYFHNGTEPGDRDTQVCTKCSLLVSETSEKKDAKAQMLASNYPRKFICDLGVCPDHRPASSK